VTLVAAEIEAADLFLDLVQQAALIRIATVYGRVTAAVVTTALNHDRSRGGGCGGGWNRIGTGQTRRKHQNGSVHWD
jgi:hypothetical protein